MDYKNVFGPGCACAVGLGEGKRESDEEEYGLVVGKVMRKNIHYSKAYSDGTRHCCGTHVCWK